MTDVLLYEPRWLIRVGLSQELQAAGLHVDGCFGTLGELTAGAMLAPPGSVAIACLDAAPVTVGVIGRLQLIERRMRLVVVRSCWREELFHPLRDLPGGIVVDTCNGVEGLVRAVRDRGELIHHDPVQITDDQRSGAQPVDARADWDDRPGEQTLTGREARILRLIAEGATAASAARSLGISPKTVGSHKQRIFGKLGVQSQAHAVAVGIRLGLVGAYELRAVGD